MQQISTTIVIDPPWLVSEITAVIKKKKNKRHYFISKMAAFKQKAAQC